MRTFVVEIGSGVDLHGMNATTAAIRAVRNCFQHVSLPGLRSVAGLTDLEQMQVEVVLGVPSGNTVDTAEVAAVFPHGKPTITVEPGGLLAPGGGNPDDKVLIVNAVLYVRVE